MTQTPAEVADALSEAVDNLEISLSDNWADAGAADMSQNGTKVSNKHNQTVAGNSEVQVEPNKSQNNTLMGTLGEAAQVSLQANSQVCEDSNHSQRSSFKGSQSQGPFICEKCQKTCRSRAGLKSHSRIHAD